MEKILVELKICYSQSSRVSKLEDNKWWSESRMFEIEIDHDQEQDVTIG